MAAQPERLESIDALRGIAFLGVLLVHCGQTTPAFLWKDVTVVGAFGVSLFFIASAFTLLSSHRQRRNAEPSPILAFFIRRVFRIVPLFWAGIVFYYVIYGSWNRGWAEGSLNWFHFGLSALLLHGWHPDTISAAVPGGWSIAAEFGFYALAPLLFVFIKNWRRDSFAFLWLPFHLPTFVLGFLAYHLLPKYRSLGGLAKRTCLVTVCVALAGCALALPLRVNDYVLPALLAAFVVALIADPAPLLVNRWICALGTVSFSAYITHFAALKVIQKVLERLPQIAPEASFLLLFLFALALTAVTSWLTYRWIEQPGIALGRKLLQEVRKRSEFPITTAHVQATRIVR